MKRRTAQVNSAAADRTTTCTGKAWHGQKGKVEQGSHLRSHSGVIGPDGNECGADGGALGCHVQAGGSNADALGSNVDPLHMHTASSLVDIPYSGAQHAAALYALCCVRCAAPKWL